MKEWLQPEVVKMAPEVVLYLSTLLVAIQAFSRLQREKIVNERDQGKCQAPFAHQCNEKRGLELHHIRPQRYAKWVGVPEWANDVPENGLSICQAAHRRIHPDMDKTLKQYHYMKRKGINAFDNMFQWRESQLRQKKIYWNDQWDRAMAAMAAKLTAQWKQRGGEFPFTKKQLKHMNGSR